jgi:uncharacterized protein YaeQ
VLPPCTEEDAIQLWIEYEDADALRAAFASARRRRVSHFTVTAVGARSPAKNAGFEKSDVLAAVDATPAANVSLA